MQVDDMTYPDYCTLLDTCNDAFYALSIALDAERALDSHQETKPELPAVITCFGDVRAYQVAD